MEERSDSGVESGKEMVVREGTPPEAARAGEQVNSGAGEEVEGMMVALSAEQRVALRELVAKRNIGLAAAAARVNRRTVSRWIHEDAEFAAALHAWKRELMDAARAEAAAMLGPALKTLRKAIKNGDKRVALEV